jgi:DNA-directed RNA polymerase sigma subunit (sigma70/sigma32)
LDIKRMNFNEQALTQILGRKPTTPELAKLLGVKKERVHQLKAYISREPISLDNLEQDRHFEENDE